MTKPASNQPKFNYCNGDYESITGKLLLVDWKATFLNMNIYIHRYTNQLPVVQQTYIFTTSSMRFVDYNKSKVDYL